MMKNARPFPHDARAKAQAGLTLVELMVSLNLLDRFLWERGGRGWSKPDAAEVLELMTQVATRVALLSRDLALLYTPPTDDEADIG